MPFIGKQKLTKKDLKVLSEIDSQEICRAGSTGFIELANQLSVYAYTRPDNIDRVLTHHSVCHSSFSPFRNADTKTVYIDEYWQLVNRLHGHDILMLKWLFSQDTIYPQCKDIECSYSNYFFKLKIPKGLKVSFDQFMGPLIIMRGNREINNAAHNNYVFICQKLIDYGMRRDLAFLLCQSFYYSPALGFYTKGLTINNGHWVSSPYTDLKKFCNRNYKIPSGSGIPQTSLMYRDSDMGDGTIDRVFNKWLRDNEFKEIKVNSYLSSSSTYLIVPEKIKDLNLAYVNELSGSKK